MITAYFLISAILIGWFSGHSFSHGHEWSLWEALGIIGLCIVWPFLAFVLFKMWREGKL